MAKPPKLTRPVAANRGIEIAYRRAMEKLIREMHDSVNYWLAAGFKKYPPRMTILVDKVAQDTAAAPSAKIKRILDDLAKRWIVKFDESAPVIADKYMRGQFKATDSAFRQALKDAGWTVEFKLTPAVRDAFEASLNENVGLIRSIPQEYLQKVEGVVMRSYTAGRDLSSMVKGLQEIYPGIGKRAHLIARDQSNKANAVVNRARNLQLGLTQGIWMHSGAGKTPRPAHLEAGKDRLVFDIAKGAPVGPQGKYVLPGEEINCRCTYRVKLPI